VDTAIHHVHNGYPTVTFNSEAHLAAETSSGATVRLLYNVVQGNMVGCLSCAVNANSMPSPTARAGSSTSSQRFIKTIGISRYLLIQYWIDLQSIGHGFESPILHKALQQKALFFGGNDFIGSEPKPPQGCDFSFPGHMQRIIWIFDSGMIRPYIVTGKYSEITSIDPGIEFFT